MPEEFATYIQHERERLSGRLDDIRERRAALLAEQGELDKEFAAINAYEAAKTGTAPAKSGAVSRTRRAKNGSRRNDILRAVSAAPAGMTRGELLELFGLKGDKSGEMAISNALTSMTKGGHVVRDAGRYYAPTEPYQRQAAE